MISQAKKDLYYPHSLAILVMTWSKLCWLKICRINALLLFSGDLKLLSYVGFWLFTLRIAWFPFTSVFGTKFCLFEFNKCVILISLHLFVAGDEPTLVSAWWILSITYKWSNFTFNYKFQWIYLYYPLIRHSFQYVNILNHLLFFSK